MWNVFTLRYELSACLRRRSETFCTRNAEGHYISRLQKPIRRAIGGVMALTAWLGLYLWYHPVYWMGCVAVTSAGVLLLRMRYTLTQTGLIVRYVGMRRVPLRELRISCRMIQPEITPGRTVRLYAENETMTLRLLQCFDGGAHFIMLLGADIEQNLIEPFLGTV